MKEIMELCVVLGVTMVINILLGLWNQINIEKFVFKPSVLLTGVLKAFIIALSFVGLTWVFTQVQISGADPEYIMKAAIVLYATKSTMKLCKILKIKIG